MNDLKMNSVLAFDSVTDEHGRFDFGQTLAGHYSVGRGIGGIGISVNASAGKLTECVPFQWSARMCTAASPCQRKSANNGGTQMPHLLQRTDLPPWVALPANILQMTGEQRLAWYNQWEAQTVEGQRFAAQRKLLKESHKGLQVGTRRIFAADLHGGTSVASALFLENRQWN